jgi:hypothetical protein
MRDVLDRALRRRRAARTGARRCATRGTNPDGWGFGVILAKLPLLPDGHPAGIITAFRLDAEPTFFP